MTVNWARILLEVSEAVYFRIVLGNRAFDSMASTIKHDLRYLNYLDLKFHNYSISFA